jgi:hypothetical protein
MRFSLNFSPSTSFPPLFQVSGAGCQVFGIRSHSLFKIVEFPQLNNNWRCQHQFLVQTGVMMLVLSFAVTFSSHLLLIVKTIRAELLNCDLKSVKA